MIKSFKDLTVGSQFIIGGNLYVKMQPNGAYGVSPSDGSRYNSFCLTQTRSFHLRYVKFFPNNEVTVIVEAVNDE